MHSLPSPTLVDLAWRQRALYWRLKRSWVFACAVPLVGALCHTSAGARLGAVACRLWLFADALCACRSSHGGVVGSPSLLRLPNARRCTTTATDSRALVISCTASSLGGTFERSSKTQVSLCVKFTTQHECATWLRLLQPEPCAGSAASGTPDLVGGSVRRGWRGDRCVRALVHNWSAVLTGGMPTGYPLLRGPV